MIDEFALNVLNLDVYIDHQQITWWSWWLSTVLDASPWESGVNDDEEKMKKSEKITKVAILDRQSY